jgi:hypothetical protein
MIKAFEVEPDCEITAREPSVPSAAKSAIVEKSEMGVTAKSTTSAISAANEEKEAMTAKAAMNLEASFMMSP